MRTRTSGAIGSRYFRMDFVAVVYACREANGSMKPVMSEGERKERYCPQCTAPQCLFAVREPEEGEQGRNEAKVRAGRNKSERMRSKGLNSPGNPLQESCWNCTSMREVFDCGYVCQFEPDEKAVSRWTMEHRLGEKRWCDGERFELRLTMGIPFLDDALGGGE